MTVAPDFSCREIRRRSRSQGHERSASDSVHLQLQALEFLTRREGTGGCGAIISGLRIALEVPWQRDHIGVGAVVLFFFVDFLHGLGDHGSGGQVVHFHRLRSEAADALPLRDAIVCTRERRTDPDHLAFQLGKFATEIGMLTRFHGVADDLVECRDRTDRPLFQALAVRYRPRTGRAGRDLLFSRIDVAGKRLS